MNDTTNAAKAYMAEYVLARAKCEEDFAKEFASLRAERTNHIESLKRHFRRQATDASHHYEMRTKERGKVPLKRKLRDAAEYGLQRIRLSLGSTAKITVARGTNALDRRRRRKDHQKDLRNLQSHFGDWINPQLNGGITIDKCQEELAILRKEQEQQEQSRLINTDKGASSKKTKKVKKTKRQYKRERRELDLSTIDEE
ncbi:hypothetical protein K4K61_005783 [Colletotrichum sp. SAR11_59]|uniref:Uncharacterized protein n=1 Tax=Colletotrichum asianum TaxID=702518 RepID=A0A8H3ZPB1_9PEZI|nr:hypothetical protein GQ607_005275 [Colletotrichum asianum]KAI8314122.1 hypothetical protein K4K61_005783 [Colletotrichum sp. SAR11_59]